MEQKINQHLDLIAQLEKKLGITFTNKQLCLTALTHKSYAHTHSGMSHNERLEFLGDAVLKLVISEYLFQQYPSTAEGDLSKMRGQYVSDRNLAQIGKKLNLGEYMRFSQNEINTGGRTRNSNLANVFEAILGAYFLDKGIDSVRQFLMNMISLFKENFAKENVTLDFKSRLQEILQQHKTALPEYHVLKEEGPDHEKVFHIEAVIYFKSKRYYTTGLANTKKEAEQLAAKTLLEQIFTE